MSLATQQLPSTSVTEQPAGAAFAPDGLAEVVVFAGPALRGTVNQPTLFAPRDIASLVSTFGAGDAVKQAAYGASQVASGFVFIRLATASVVGTINDVVAVIAGSPVWTHTMTGTPTDGADVLINFVLGGTTGTGPITYKVSLDGGATYGNNVSLGTATSIVLEGVTIALGSSKTITTGDTLAYWTTAPSSSILTQASTIGSTSSLTASGTPIDKYEVIFRVRQGGTVGSASPAIKYDYSLDGGYTFQPVANLGTSTTVALVDAPLSAELTGITITAGAGDLTAGDVLTFATSGPQYDSAGVTAGISSAVSTGLAAWTGNWTWIKLCGEVRAALAATVNSICTAWDAAGHPMWAEIDTRDRGTTEPLAAWSTRWQAEYASLTSTHVGWSAGMARITCPINGRRNRRPAATAILGRAMSLPIQVDWAQFDLGPLEDASIVDTNGNVVEHDANRDPSIQAMGGITLRTWPGEVGVYPTGAQLPGPSTDIQRVPLRRVMNVAKTLYAKILRLQAVKAFRVNKAGVKAPLIAGNLIPADEAKINRLGNDILKRGLYSTGMVSAVTFAVNPTPVSLGGGAYKLLADMQITALIYVVEVDGTARYVSATLSQALAGTVG